LEIEISCSQWEGSACTQSALIYEVPPKFNFYFFGAMSQFDWPSIQKNETMQALQNIIEGSILKSRVPPHWPTYVGQHLAKHMR
jgi:hypothetical protein